MAELNQIIGQYESFVDSINKGLDRAGVSRDELAMCDHVCYRVETDVQYSEMKQKLAQTALSLGETEVAGRMIATYEFDQPLEAGDWKIPYLELPQPKEASPYPEGLEHAEFVVIGSLARFQARHADLPFKTTALGRTLNPELGLKRPGLSVKFHMAPLGAVIGIEERLAQ